MDITLAISGAIALFVFAAAGTVIGTSIASSAAIGAWKKCFAHNRPAPFTLVAFVGMTMTNVLYGMLLMVFILGKINDPKLEMLPGGGWALLAICSAIGFVMGLASYAHARAAAYACDAQGETGQGVGKYITAIGIIEGVTLFVFVFSLLAIGNFFTAKGV